MRNPPTPLFEVLEVTATDEEQGPLVRQSPPAAQIARECHHAATTLWDLATYDNPQWMRKRAREVARAILQATKEPPKK